MSYNYTNSLSLPVLFIRGAAIAMVISNISQPVFLIIYIKILKIHKQTWGGQYYNNNCSPQLYSMYLFNHDTATMASNHCKHYSLSLSLSLSLSFPVGLIHLARQGSVRIRRSIRGRASLKKEDFEGSLQNNQALNSEENLVDVSTPNTCTCTLI